MRIILSKQNEKAFKELTNFNEDYTKSVNSILAVADTLSKVESESIKEKLFANLKTVLSDTVLSATDTLEQNKTDVFLNENIFNRVNLEYLLSANVANKADIEKVLTTVETMIDTELSMYVNTYDLKLGRYLKDNLFISGNKLQSKSNDMLIVKYLEFKGVPVDDVLKGNIKVYKRANKLGVVEEVILDGALIGGFNELM